MIRFYMLPQVHILESQMLEASVQKCEREF
jgi:hypothetical protein